MSLKLRYSSNPEDLLGFKILVEGKLKKSEDVYLFTHISLFFNK